MRTQPKSCHIFILLAGEPSFHTVSLARFHLIRMVSLCNDMQEVPGFNMAQVWGIKIIQSGVFVCYVAFLFRSSEWKRCWFLLRNVCQETVHPSFVELVGAFMKWRCTVPEFSQLALEIGWLEDIFPQSRLSEPPFWRSWSLVTRHVGPWTEMWGSCLIMQCVLFFFVAEWCYSQYLIFWCWKLYTVFRCSFASILLV